VRLFWTFSVVCLAALASGQTPEITGVYRVCSLNTDFAPGATIFILGTFPPPVVSYSLEYSIALDGVNVDNFGIADHLIEARIPLTTPTGSHSLTVSWNGRTSNFFPISTVPLAPGFLEFNVSLSSPAAVPQFSPCNPVTQFPADTPVTPASGINPGELLTVLVDGVGSAPGTPTVAFGGSLPGTPPVSGGLIAQITNTTASGGQIEIDFIAPTEFLEGIEAMVVTVGGVSTPPLYIGVLAHDPIQAPSVAAVVNGASFGSVDVVAAGSIVSIFGAFFGDQDNLSAFPSTSVNGISVLFGLPPATTPAPIFALSGSLGQINVLAPADLPPSGTIDLTVQYTGQDQVAFTVASLKLAPTAPGIFFDIDPLVLTRHNAVAVVANTAWIAMPLSMAANLGLPSGCTTTGSAGLCGQPAHPGDVLQVYVTGLGTATPNGDPNGTVLPTGIIAPVNGDPLYSTVATPTVTIGGQAAAVLFSGLAPGYAGLYQVNVQIPSTVPPGDDVPIQISLAGASDTATVAIAAP
jgi:uncharacterized protein (TIGR03437 family)